MGVERNEFSREPQFHPIQDQSPNVLNDLLLSPEFQQISLSERLAMIQANQIGDYNAETFSRVEAFVHFEENNPDKRKQYKLFETIEDFQLYYRLHPEWQGKSRKQLRKAIDSGGGAFYSAFIHWVYQQTSNAEEQESLREQLIPMAVQRQDWSELDTIQKWKEELDSHPEWFEKTLGELETSVKTRRVIFYRAFDRWVKIQTQDTTEQGALKKQVIPPPQKVSPKTTDITEQELFSETTKQTPRAHLKTVEDWIVEYQRHPEWQGKSTSQIQFEEGGTAFYSAFKIWIAKRTDNLQERADLFNQIFPSRHKDWSSLTSITDWQDEFYKHPEWQGKSRRQLEMNPALKAGSYYASLNFWIRKQTTDPIEREKLRQMIIPSRHKSFYAQEKLPDEFLIKRESVYKRENKRNIQALGQHLEVREPNNITFVKGEVAEQMMGVLLSYAFPKEMIIPQYCLDAGVKDGQGYFKTRVDYKVDNNFYEVKWGNALSNIQDTIKKHLPYVTGDTNYHLIRFEELVSLNLPDRVEGLSFITLLQETVHDPEVRATFELLGVTLLEMAESENIGEDVRLLRYMRDFLYTIINESNIRKGPARQKFISETLHEAMTQVYESREAFESFLISHRHAIYSPLEAYFTYQDKLYRSSIQIAELHNENPKQYAIRYLFGDVEFANELDRNIAVMIELSDYGIHIENCLANPDMLQVEPVFILPNGLLLSRKGGEGIIPVNSLEEVKEMLQIPKEEYEFGLEYIKENDTNC